MNVKDNTNDEDVKNALRVIEKFFSERCKQNGIIDKITDTIDECFTVTHPKGNRQLNSQKLHQAMWRTASRMKPNDFTLHGNGKDDVSERIQTAGLKTILRNGNYNACLRDKNGGFYDLLLYGDCIMHLGTSDNKGVPIDFSCIDLKNVYVDVEATAIRAVGKGRSAQKMVIIASYSWDHFCRLFPEYKKKAGVGRIPRNFSEEQKLTKEQELAQENIIEVAYSYDLTTKCFLVFAGPGCTIIEKDKQKKKFLFNMDGEDYIPILQLPCIPSSRGFFNYGIGHLLYRIAIVSRQLMNMEVRHVKDNVLPIELISVAQGNASKFFQQLKTAYELQAKGMRGFLPVERGASDPSGNAVSSQTLLSQNLFNELQALWDRLDQEIRRSGINIDELDTGGNKTATEILALEENSNSFVKQIGEWGGSEQIMAIKIAIDFTKKFVKKSNKTPLDLTTKFNIEGKEVRLDDLTLGDIAEEFQQNHWFVEPNLRSGAIPSNAALIAGLSSQFGFAAPGSRAQVKIIDMLGKINNIDIPGEDYIAPMQQAPAPQEGPTPQQQPTGTDRLSINPYLDEPAAAI